MDSIAVTKPDMGILSQKRLVLSPFGTLSQAFTQELLARAGIEEGHWPFVPLDLLEEGPIDPPVPPVQPVLQVDLSLILQTMRQSEYRTERTAQRIVERMIRLRERGRADAAPVQTVSRGTDRYDAVKTAAQSTKQGPVQQRIQPVTTAPVQSASWGADRHEAVKTAAQGGKQGPVQQGVQAVTTAPVQSASRGTDRHEAGKTAAQGGKQGPVQQTAQPVTTAPVQSASRGADRYEAVKTAAQGTEQGPVQQRVQPATTAPVQSASRGTDRYEAAKAAAQSGKQGPVQQRVQNITQETAYQLVPNQNQSTPLPAPQDPKQGGGQDTVRTPEPPVSAAGSFAHRQNFYSTINQHIQFITNIRQAGLIRPRNRSLIRQTVSDRVSRRSWEFFRPLPQQQRKGGHSSTRLAAHGGVIPSMEAAAWSSDAGTAPDLSGWRWERGEFNFLRRDGERMLPEELSYLEEGADKFSAGWVEEAADAVVRRYAQRALRQLSRKRITQAFRPEILKPSAAEKQVTGLGQFVQKQVDHAAARQSRWLPRLNWEAPAQEDWKTTAISSDGLSMTRMAEYGGRTGRSIERQAEPGPSMAVHRQPGLPPQDHSSPAMERWQSEINQKADVSPLARDWSRTRASRQPVRPNPMGTLVEQENHPLSFGPRKVRLAGEGFGRFGLAYPENPTRPQTSLTSASLLGGELTHRTPWKEEGVSGRTATAGQLGQKAPAEQDIRAYEAVIQARIKEPPEHKGPRIVSKPAVWTAPEAELQTTPAAGEQPSQGASKRSFSKEKASGRGVYESGGRSRTLEAPSFHNGQPAQEAASVQADALTAALFAPEAELTYWTEPEPGGTPDPVRSKAAGGQTPVVQNTQTARRASRPGSPQELLKDLAAEAAGQTEETAVQGYADSAVSAQRRVLETALQDIRLSFAELSITGQGAFADREREIPRKGQNAVPYAPYAQALPLEKIEYRAQTMDGPSPASQGERPAHQPAQTHMARTVWNRSTKGKTAQTRRNRPADWKTSPAAPAQQSLPDAGQRFQEGLTGQINPSPWMNRGIQDGQPDHRTGAGTERTIGLSHGMDRQNAPALEPLELAYSGLTQMPDAAPAVPAAQGQTPAGTPADSDYIRGLPDWARRFLQEGAPQTREEAVQQMGAAQRLDAGQTMTSARNISALSFPEGGTFEWTAPDYRAPTPMEYRERPQRQEQQPQSAHISDAEVQRTAERVYRIIEDRIRRERHRMGL